MLFCLDRSLVSYMQTCRSLAKVARAIECLLEAHLNQRHLVVAEPGVARKLRERLTAKLSADGVAGLKLLDELSVTTAILISELPVHVRVVGGRPRRARREGNEIRIHITELTTSERLQKTVLLAEGEDDADFYCIMAETWLETREQRMKLRALSKVACTPQSGNGNNIGRALARRVEERVTCVAIADSDRWSSTDERVGAPAITLRKVKTSPRQVAYVLTARELENLLSPELIVAACKGTQRAKAERYRWLCSRAPGRWQRYADLKEGVSWRVLRERGCHEHDDWRPLVAHYQSDQAGLCGAETRCKKGNRRCECEVVPALGEKLPGQVVAKLKPMSHSERARWLDFENLSELSEIAYLVVSFCCANRQHRQA